MRNDIALRQEEIQGWIDEKRSKAFIYRQLKCKPETLDSWLTRLGISYSGNRGGKGWKTSNQRMTFQEYVTICEVPKTTLVKKKLLEDGIKDYICEGCRGIEWLGDPIPLQLHHVDGNKFNNLLDNLQLLCPNCHSLTPNYAGKGVVNYVRVAELADAPGLGPG